MERCERCAAPATRWLTPAAVRDWLGIFACAACDRLNVRIGRPPVIYELLVSRRRRP